MANKTELGLGENVEGALCYVLGWITGIVFLVLEGKNDFIKFHAMQSIVTFLPLTILVWLFGTIGGTFGGFWWGFSPFFLLFTVLSWLIGLFTLILWLILMLKAYQGERYKLPIIGDIVEQRM
ncbi:MAG: DUF4870 domain-containing protein [Thermoproteota archaeon]